MLVASTSANGACGIYRLHGAGELELVIDLRIGDKDPVYYATGLAVDCHGRLFVSWAFGDKPKTLAQRIRVFENQNGVYAELKPNDAPESAPLALSASHHRVFAASADGLRVINSKLETFHYNDQNARAAAKDLHHLTGVAWRQGKIYVTRAVGCTGDHRILECRLKRNGELTCEVSPFTTGYSDATQDDDYLTPGPIHFVKNRGVRLWSCATFADSCNRPKPSGIIQLGRVSGVVAPFVLKSTSNDKSLLSWPADFLFVK